MSNRSTWITVVLCAGALHALAHSVCVAQIATGADAPSPPKSPASPPNPTSPSAEKNSPKVANSPASPKSVVESPDADADARMKRLADRFSKDLPAPSNNKFDASQDPISASTNGDTSNGNSVATSSQRRAASKADEVNRQKLMDPEDLEPLGPRQGTPAGNVESDSDFGQSGGWVLNLITALGVVLVLIYLLRSSIGRWFGRAGSTGASPVVEVLTRVAVAPRNHVLLLRVGSRILIVGDSSAGLRTLGQVDDAEEVADLLTHVSAASSSSASGGFRRMLQGFNGEYTAENERNELGEDEGEVHVDRTRDRLAGLVGKLRTIGKGGRS